MLRPGIAIVKKVSKLEECDFTPRRLVGAMEYKHTFALATEKPSFALW
jgi:hypothetical protein